MRLQPMKGEVLQAKVSCQQLVPGYVFLRSSYQMKTEPWKARCGFQDCRNTLVVKQLPSINHIGPAVRIGTRRQLPGALEEVQIYSIREHN